MTNTVSLGSRLVVGSQRGAIRLDLTGRLIACFRIERLRLERLMLAKLLMLFAIDKLDQLLEHLAVASTAYDRRVLGEEAVVLVAILVLGLGQPIPFEEGGKDGEVFGVALGSVAGALEFFPVLFGDQVVFVDALEQHGQKQLNFRFFLGRAVPQSFNEHVKGGFDDCVFRHRRALFFIAHKLIRESLVGQCSVRHEVACWKVHRVLPKPLSLECFVYGSSHLMLIFLSVCVD